MHMQQRKYSIKGTRSFEMTLISELRRQIEELKQENEKLGAAVRDSVRVEANMFARLEVAEDEVKRLREGEQA